MEVRVFFWNIVSHLWNYVLSVQKMAV